ncbi:carboxylating nicotinate-nucleotide diphosphorylase [Candidatus Bathyarchaeota archaeon]|nr:carboxylating nicotinate-nucleotide diphosphorylase [Candidatus Bathyarchaeota archaeon]
MTKWFIDEKRLWDFLLEDIGYDDITSEALIPENVMGSARLFFREAGVVAGISEASAIFRLLGCKTIIKTQDGTKVTTNQILLEVEGPARALLAGERTALNLVSHMSGIATKTSEIVESARKKNPLIKISATRKTLPGLRDYEKKAVELGGGDPHRIRLDDCILIKDNHLEIVSSISEALRIAKEKTSFTKKIEIEVESYEAAEEAAKAGADIIMLDNMNPDEIRTCLKKLESLGLKKDLIFEASGGINSDNYEAYAASGVDVISMGSLTHSSKALDVKLEIRLSRRKK